MDDLIRKRSATERLIIAKTLLETVLQDMPTAVPRTGKWVILDDKYYDVSKCSECGVVEYFNKGWKRFNFCPNCGARMEE